MVMVTSKMETQKIKLAIVVLNWNGKKWLSKFLPKLINNSEGGVVFLADNASSDDSIDFVRTNFPFARFVTGSFHQALHVRNF